MSFLSRSLLTRRRGGGWTLHLGEDERTLLAGLARELDDLVRAEPDHPGLKRLFPVAHPDDEARQTEWQLLMGEEVRTARRAQLALLADLATRTDLTDDEAEQWLQAVNAIRLVLGTRLDVSEDDDEPVDPDDPDAPAWAVYDFLTYLMVHTVRSLTPDLPEPTED